MSVSNKTIEQLRAVEQSNVNAAQARLTLVNKVLEGLKVGSPVPVSVHHNGYCADASMNFEGEGIAALLYQLYPPLACVDVKGSSQSQKPVKYLRNEDAREALRPIFPVLFKSSKQEYLARWWTELNGIDVEINVKNTSVDFELNSRNSYQEEFSEFLKSGKYYPDYHNYSSGSVAFFPRALATPLVRPASMVTWMQSWVDFGAAFEFSPVQKKFLVATSTKLAARAKAQDTEAVRELSLEDIGFPTSPNPEEPGDVTGPFTPKEQQLVLKFAQGQVEVLRASLDKQAEEFLIVKNWFSGFFARFGHLYDSDFEVQSYILHQLRKDTGLDVSVRIMRAHSGHASVSAYFKGWEEYPDFTFSLSTDPMAPRVKPQDIDVTYL